MVPEGLLGNAMAESSGTGRAVTPEEEMMLAYEIMKSLQMMQAEPQSGFEDEYRMDGTYAPYKLGPGNNSPQEPFWKGLWEGLKKADQSLYRPEMFGEYPESLK
jgi:hypothetical protein